MFVGRLHRKGGKSANGEEKRLKDCRAALIQVIRYLRRRESWKVLLMAFKRSQRQRLWRQVQMLTSRYTSWYPSSGAPANEGLNMFRACLISRAIRDAQCVPSWENSGACQESLQECSQMLASKSASKNITSLNQPLRNSLHASKSNDYCDTCPCFGGVLNTMRM